MRLLAAIPTLILVMALAACDPRVEVQITSDPTGASVYLNDVRAGETPLSVMVTPGKETEYKVIADEPYEDYNLYQPYLGTLNVSEATSISVWITRTTAEEQQSQRAKAEAARQREAEATERRRREAEQAAERRRREAERVAARRRIENAVFIIENWGWRRYGDNYYIVEGLVTNNTESIIRRGQAYVRFFDAGGTFMSSDWTYLDFTTLAPGQSTTFTMYADYNPRYKSARLVLVVGDTPVSTIRRSDI